MLVVIADVVVPGLADVALMIEVAAVEATEPTAAELDTTAAALLALPPLAVELVATTTHRSRMAPPPRLTAKNELFGPWLPTTPAEQVGKDSDVVVAAADRAVVPPGVLTPALTPTLIPALTATLVEVPMSTKEVEATSTCETVLELALPVPAMMQIATSCPSCALRTAYWLLLIP